MNGLIAQIEANDPTTRTLFLTSECETVDEMGAFREALESKNTSIEEVVYRESFFPLRRIRMHLSRDDFLTFMHIASGIHGLQALKLPSCMPGMLTGRHAVHTLDRTTTLQCFEADGAITFISRTHDVQPLADRLMQNRDHLKYIDLDDSHFMSKRRRSCRHGDATAIRETAPVHAPMLLDPLLNCSLPHLEQFWLSSGTAFSSSPSTTSQQSGRDRPLQTQECLFSAEALRTFLLGDTLHGSHISCLTHLRLNRLGLGDEHVLAIAEFLRGGGGALQRLEMNGNHSITRVGNQALIGSLRCNPCLAFLWTTKPASRNASSTGTTASTMGSSSARRQHSTSAETFCWSEIFSHNFHLKALSYASPYEDHNVDEGTNGRDVAVDDDDHDDDDTELQFWLALNWLGRRQLWRDHAMGLSKEEWIYVLEDVSLLPTSRYCTPSILFYLLRHYPTKLD